MLTAVLIKKHFQKAILGLMHAPPARLLLNSVTMDRSYLGTGLQRDVPGASQEQCGLV